MSFLAQLARPATRSVGAAVSIRPATAGIHSSSILRDGGSTRHENDPNVLERGKQANISQHKTGTAEWKEEIASDSEAFVKAIRSDPKESFEQLQKESSMKLKGKSREQLNEPNASD